MSVMHWNALLLAWAASLEEAIIMAAPPRRNGERKTTPIPAASAFNRCGPLAGRRGGAGTGNEASWTSPSVCGAGLPRTRGVVGGDAAGGRWAIVGGPTRASCRSLNGPSRELGMPGQDKP